ncbi:hypothetical protein EV193_1011035 [Herbihabitans rhizosphaerae]|uniref:Uncharacterized protein n=1 Tax=Herbihabitans rhizosphaerae TaxID=1872711 RepID=A0A4Q7L644_9PSEU|nr:hypothetical protein [Herbihabitans rhizosphaerae]RZS45148.1 hypothetical protein EV193_1011035 [Herbihabitans rhizosphaerae]
MIENSDSGSMTIKHLAKDVRPGKKGTRVILGASDLLPGCAFEAEEPNPAAGGRPPLAEH